MSMIDVTITKLPVAELPDDPVWLGAQPGPVIAYGDGQTEGADVTVADGAAAETLAQRIRAWPLAATALVQVLRSTTHLPAAQALDLESLAYSTLQAGPEFAEWLRERGAVALPDTATDPPVLLSRNRDRLQAVLNRPELRNPISVEMRDALVETLELLQADDSISLLELRGAGACFSVGGYLAEFGSLLDPGTAHWVRTVRSPARLLARLGKRVHAHVHGACIGSGIELPAFADRVTAHRNTFFHMPELSLGLIPGAGGTVSMTRRIGRQRVAWLVLSGRRITARTALEWGLIDAIVD